MVFIPPLLSSILSALHLLPTVIATSCNADDCLRAVRATQTPGRLQSAQLFCATFTTTHGTTTKAVPTYAIDNCPGDVIARVSSACSCIVTTSKAIQTSHSISRSSTPTTSSVIVSSVKTHVLSVSSTSAKVSTTPPVSTDSACAIVSRSSASQMAINPSATPTVSPQLAYECLNSVPLGKQEALDLVDSIVQYLTFQTDLNYRKDPPADYYYPAIDVLSLLQRIRGKVEGDEYVNEYSFQVDLYKPFAQSHDAHLIFYPDLLTGVVDFGRNVTLVSISDTDTGVLPEVYFKHDVNLKKVSPIIKINGIATTTFIQQVADSAAAQHDADSAYNSMFYSASNFASTTIDPTNANGVEGFFSHQGRTAFIYPGQNTTYEFKNGTKFTLENTARIRGNFDGVSDGVSAYQAFCVGADGYPAPGIAGGTPIYPITEDTFTNLYTKPIFVSNDTIISLYYLADKGYQNVAVLSIMQFYPIDGDIANYQASIEHCLSISKAAGKTRLIIDLQSNGGGYPILAADTFRQLFPHIIQDFIYRRIENPIFSTLSTIISNLSSTFDPSTFDPNTADDATFEFVAGYVENDYNYRWNLNLTDQNFLTFQDRYAPQAFKGEAYTPLTRYNFSDSIFTSDIYGIDVTGYLSRQHFTQPFLAEDILLLYDGVCGSSCSIFAAAMSGQAHVQSVAFGGRPNRAAIQGVGGVKGAVTTSFGQLYSDAQYALQYATSSDEEEVLNKLNLVALNRSPGATMNIADQIYKEDINDGVPAQYIREEADCRLYWTKEMIGDIREVWKAAAKAKWGGGACVAGKF